MPSCRTRRLRSIEDDVGRFARDLDRGQHRDADVGGVERGRIVDAVAQEPDDVAALLQGDEDPVLLGRRDAREDRRLLRDMAASAVSVSRSISSPGTTRAHVQTDVRTDVPRDELVVARQDLHLDAVAAEGLRASRARPAGPDRRS